MRHFNFLKAPHRTRLFHLEPETFTVSSDPKLLAVALGATLYCPATRPDLAGDVLKQASRGLTSVVICLEDSIADRDVMEGELNVAKALRELHERLRDGGTSVHSEMPMIFLRIRNPEQMRTIATLCGESLRVLTGFVFPKFENEAGEAHQFFDALQLINRTVTAGNPESGRRLRAMPILETPAIVHQEKRLDALSRIHRVLELNRRDVLAVRIGATDLSSVFGLRRSPDLTIYDVRVIASAIGDIVNQFGRTPDGWVISAPVWEHFTNTERVFRPQLRATPFAAANEMDLRLRILRSNLDGLIREIELDQANGLTGKTVIHPSHVPVVHAMSVVSHEEYLDATDILDAAHGGAKASPYANKMNEIKPHRMWAERTILRARAFGVAAPDITFVELLEASMQ